MLRRLLTRFGYAAMGAVYATLGIVAVRVALDGSHDRVRGFAGAFRVLLSQEHGRLIVTCVAAGLFAFVLARLVDASDRRWSMWGRVLAFFDAAGHAGLAWMAIAILLRLRHDSRFPRSALSWLLGQPWGSMALDAAGIVVIAIGVFQIWQALSGRMRRQLKGRKDLGAVLPFAIRVGRFGYVVRGLVTVIIGWFLFRTARDIDPRSFHEIGGALEVIHAVRFGSFLLTVAGLGLAAYGSYLVFLGFFRKPN